MVRWRQWRVIRPSEYFKMNKSKHHLVKRNTVKGRNCHLDEMKNEGVGYPSIDNGIVTPTTTFKPKGDSRTCFVDLERSSQV